MKRSGDENLRPGESNASMGCGQPQWHHDPAYCGPECSWYEGPDDEDDN